MASKKIDLGKFIGNYCAVKMKNGYDFNGYVRGDNRSRFHIVLDNGMRFAFKEGEVKTIDFAEPPKPKKRVNRFKKVV